MRGGQMLVERALPRKLLAAILALGALIHALPALVHRAHMLHQVAVPPEQLPAPLALQVLRAAGPLRGVDRADVIVKVGEGGADAAAVGAADAAATCGSVQASRRIGRLGRAFARRRGRGGG